MSAGEFLTDLFSGNFTHAFNRLQDWYNGWPPELKTFVHKLTDDEGQILFAAARTGLLDVLAGKSFEQVVNDVWETLKEQVPNKAKADLADALGILVRAQ